MNKDEIRRFEAKTPEQRFLQVLAEDFHCAPKVAQAVLEEAEACLAGKPGQIKPGQVRVILTKYEAGHGRALRDTAMTETVWTVTAGQADQRILAERGRQGLRWVRLQRLLEEAL